MKSSAKSGVSKFQASKSKPSKSQPEKPAKEHLRVFLVPCSCGTTFAVAPDYDRRGTAWSRYLPCPQCGKRHDPKNRLLQIGYQREGYWKVDGC